MALIEACIQGNLERLEQLISTSHDVNETAEQAGTALRLAAASGRSDIARILMMKANADVHLKNWKGQTVLHLASSEGHEEMVELFVDSGSNIDEQDEAGKTPLMLATKMGQSSIVNKLILAGAKVGLGCVESQTALHYAAEGNHIDCGTLLVEAGADVTAADVKSQTPLDIASVEFYEAIQHKLALSLKQVVVVAGGADCDASTLITALQEESKKMGKELVQVPQAAAEGVSSNEAAQLLGHLEAQFYNIVGHYNFVRPNQSILETLLSKPGVPATLLLQVKANEEEGIIQKKLLHWLRPLAPMSSPSAPQVIVVGDCLDQYESEPQTHEKLQRCTQSIQEELHVQIKGHILVDCQNPQSKCINKISRLVREFSQSRPAASNVQYNLSLVVSKIHSLVKAWPWALQLHEFAKWVDDTKTDLPRNLPSPEEVCQDLSAAGYALFLPNEQDPSHSWLILDLQALLHDVYGKVNEFGLLHCSQLAELFPNLDQSMTQEVLTSLEFCIQIDPQLLKEELLQLTIDKGEEGWLYFPTLVLAQAREVFPEDSDPQRFQWVCWQLKTVEKQGIPAHLLQTVLRHATTHKESLKVKEHSCNVWMNGVSWSSTKGVDVAVQTSDSSVVQVVGRSKAGSEELYQYTSAVVRDVIQAIPELSLRLKTEPYIVHPYTLAMWENPEAPSPDTLYPIMSIVKGIHRGNGYIPSLPGEAGRLPNLIRLEELFGGCSPPLSTLEDIAGYIHCEWHGLIITFIYVTCTLVNVVQQLLTPHVTP